MWAALEHGASLLMHKLDHREIKESRLKILAMAEAN
jgi:hypothetical protein